MTEKTYTTPSGTIHYWINIIDENAVTLVFLPGLTADYRLFEKQIEYFESNFNVFVWDTSAHASSWPFNFDFTLKDKAGSCIRYTKAWHKNTGIPVKWIENAEHNSNTNKAEVINQLIEDFVRKIPKPD